MSFLKKLFGNPTKSHSNALDKVIPPTKSTQSVQVGSIALCDGPLIDKMDEFVKDPSIDQFSEMELMMNAAANLMAMKQEGKMHTLIENGRLVGLWIHSFPGNTTRQVFMRLLLADLKELGNVSVPNGIYEAYAAVSDDSYRIYKNSAGPGCIIRF